MPIRYELTWWRIRQRCGNFMCWLSRFAKPKSNWRVWNFCNWLFVTGCDIYDNTLVDESNWREARVQPG